MTTTAPHLGERSTPLSRVTRIIRLQLNVPLNSVLTPAAILALVFVISAVIALTVQRATGASAADPEYVAGVRSNSGAVWSLPGFLVYFGVQSVATQFPFALALGTTRRAFTLGTLASHVAVSAYVAVLGAIGLGLELVTGHWFAGIYVFDTYALGSGHVGQLLLTLFLGALAALSIGGAFGAVWVRFGAKGPIIVAVALAITLSGALLLSVPAWPWIAAHFALWWLAAVALVLTLVAVTGELLALRRTSVR